MSTQVRMQVSKTVSAKIHFIAKSLEVSTSFVYEMITVAYLVDHGMEDAIERLAPYATNEPQMRPSGLSQSGRKGN